MSHVCSECRWGQLGFPCRVEGRPDADRVAAHRVEHLFFGTDDELPWSAECLWSAIDENPEFGWAVLVACLPRLTSGEQAGLLGAGHLEDLIAQHGEQFIDRIVALARQNPRFRYVPSGVWPQGRDRAGMVWQRIERFRTSGRIIDRGDTLPPA